MGMNERPPEVFRDLLERARLPEREAAERVERALDEQYWRGLVGGSGPPSPLTCSADAHAVAAAVAAFKRDGVYQVAGAITHDALARVNAIVDAVAAAGWPPVFAFACDELWECARLAPVRLLVEGALGAGAKQIPHVWAHVVKPGGGHAGWSPHVDGPGADRLTVWLALSDAGLDDGCMYAVPRNAAVEKSLAEWCERDQLEKNNVKALLHATRALPACAGDLLGWAFDIVHWGGVAGPKSPGRRSLSFEFIAPHAAPGPTDDPLVPLSGPLPSHTARLRAIATALLEYKKFEPLVLRYEDVATTLLAR